jgi:AcrR family transcriptional regulator
VKNPRITPTEQSLNKSGQSMRRKGQDKYERLVQATAEILSTNSVSQVKAADIARAATTSAPNFYLYFSSVQDAVLAAVQQVSMANPEILALLQAPWPEPGIERHALAFVQTYLAHWQKHAPLLRVRSILVAEGDERFRLAEMQASEEVLKALTAKYCPDGMVPDGTQALKLTAAAGVMLAMLDRLAAYLPSSGAGHDLMDACLLEAAAQALALGIRHARQHC